MVNMGSKVQGDGETDYLNYVQCDSIRHGIDLMVLQEGTSDADKPTRVEGCSVHGDVEFSKDFDKASPQLRAACAASTAIGEVVVKRIVTANDADSVVEEITLGNTKIAAVGMYTHPSANGMGMEGNMREVFTLEYDSITWKNTDGNIERTHSVA
jgi:type VI secretion system Hcp family effector